MRHVALTVVLAGCALAQPAPVKPVERHQCVRDGEVVPVTSQAACTEKGGSWLPVVTPTRTPQPAPKPPPGQPMKSEHPS